MCSCTISLSPEISLLAWDQNCFVREGKLENSHNITAIEIPINLTAIEFIQKLHKIYL